MGKPIIYGTLLSANVRKVHAVIKEIGIEFVEHNVNVYAGEGQNEKYLEINPMGQVPLLSDGAVHLRESNAILVHLCKHYGGSYLFNNSPQHESEILQWLFWESAQWQPVLSDIMAADVGHILLPNLIEKPNHSSDWTNSKGLRLLTFLENSLKSDYLTGDSITIADFAVAGMTTYFNATAFPSTDFPRIKTWLTRLDARESWKSTLHPAWKFD